MMFRQYGHFGAGEDPHVELLPDGGVKLTGVDQWGGRMDTVYESMTYYKNAVPVLKRYVTAAQGEQLERFAAGITTAPPPVIAVIDTATPAPPPTVSVPPSVVATVPPPPEVTAQAPPVVTAPPPTIPVVVDEPPSKGKRLPRWVLPVTVIAGSLAFVMLRKKGAS